MAEAKRKAFRATRIKALIKKNLLHVELIPGTLLLHTTSGSTVWQMYFNWNKTRLIGQHVWIRKGCFLMPHRQKVTAKELAFWAKKNVDLESVGIFIEGTNYYRYDFYRDEDWSTIDRQQGHISNSYLFGSGFQTIEKLMQFVDPRTKKILGRISDRKRELKKLNVDARKTLVTLRNNLQNTLDSSKGLNDSFPSPHDTDFVCSFLSIYAQRCLDPKLCFKPFSYRLVLGSNALKKSSSHLKEEKFQQAKAFLRLAIHHLDIVLTIKTS